MFSSSFYAPYHPRPSRAGLPPTHSEERSYGRDADLGRCGEGRGIRAISSRPDASPGRPWTIGRGWSSRVRPHEAPIPGPPTRHDAVPGAPRAGPRRFQQPPASATVRSRVSCLSTHRWTPRWPVIEEPWGFHGVSSKLRMASSLPGPASGGQEERQRDKKVPYWAGRLVRPDPARGRGRRPGSGCARPACRRRAPGVSWRRVFPPRPRNSQGLFFPRSRQRPEGAGASASSRPSSRNPCSTSQALPAADRAQAAPASRLSVGCRSPSR